MPDILVSEEKQYNTKKDVKTQVQFKSKTGSRSFTVHGTDQDYLYNLFFSIVKKLSETDANSLRIVFYKTP